jgi:multiple sugar transport system ATP-binding protein
MGFALRMAGKSRSEIEAAVQDAARLLRLEPLLQRRPKELSGGQRQRVAIGRAIVRRPKVFLFDEPLSNLDAALRNEMRVELAKLHEQLGATIVYVTHDQVEAMTLGDRIAVFNGGRIEQVGPPVEVYERPANRFVAGFLGSPRINLLPAALLRQAGVALPVGAVEVGVRPEHLSLTAAEAGSSARGELELVEHLGDACLAHVRLTGHPAGVIAKLAAHEAGRWPRHATVALGFDATELMFFDAQGARLAA